MKLFAAIYDDARLLPHFLRHYERRGITEFFIASSPAFAPTTGDFVNDYRINLVEGLDVADSFLGGSAAMTEMRKRYQQDDEWVVIVDLDEFVEFMPDIHAVVAAAEREHANVVRGIMYDEAYPVVPGYPICCIVAWQPATRGRREGACGGKGTISE